MSAEPAEQLVARLKGRSLDRFVTLCKMHLSFLLDLPGNGLEELLGSPSSSSEGASSDKLWGFGNFARKKSIKELSKSFDDDPVFGAPLTTSVIGRVRPLVRFLELEENLNQEGLFRKCGHLGRQKTLREKVSRGRDLERDLDAGAFTAHDCANVLKLFLGELQEPLLTERHYFAHCQVAEMHNEKKKLETLQLLIHLLPDENFSLLRSVLLLLRSVAGAKQSLMTPDTLGTLFAPHLLVPKKVSPSELHRRNQTITKVVAFMIDNASLLFRLPESVMQDVRTCLWEVEMRDCPRMDFSGSDLRTDRKLSCLDVVGTRPDTCEIRTSISFTDRTASLQAAAETDTVRALGELYAHIANLPESSKKRKLLKQFNQASAVGTTPVDNSQKPRRTRSLTQSLKKLVGHAKKTSAEEAPTDSASTDIDGISPTSATELTTRQFHTPVIKQHMSRTGATVQQQPPLARLLKYDRQQPLSILPSNLKLNTKFNKVEGPFILCHPQGGSTIRGHSWTNLTRRSSENVHHHLSHDSPAHQPLRSSFAEGRTVYGAMSHTPDHLVDDCKADFVSPVRSSPTVRASSTSGMKSLPFKKSV